VTVDSLTFVGESLFGPAATVDELLRALDATEIERAVVCPLRPQSYRLEDANDAVAAAVGRHPDRLVGFARVDPNQGDAAAAEIGLRLADLTQQVSDRYDGRVVKMLGDGVHYIFHEPSKAVLGSLEFVAAAEQRAPVGIEMHFVSIIGVREFGHPV